MVCGRENISIDVIYVHEGGGLEIIFKFQDAFKRAVANSNKTYSDNISFPENVKVI